MSNAQKIQTLHRLRDFLFAMMLRQWREEGWVVKPQFDCKAENHRQKATLATADTTEHVVKLWPHQVEKGQEVERTMVHETFGHMLFALDGTKSDERLADKIEELLWPILTKSQKQQLRNLTGNQDDGE
jgi:hypothetical protein